MWVADADFPVASQIQKALHKQVEHGVLGYEFPKKPYMEIIAARMKKLYGWEVDPEHMDKTFGPGVMITRASLEITKDPITTGIEKRRTNSIPVSDCCEPRAVSLSAVQSLHPEAGGLATSLSRLRTAAGR